MVAAEGIDVVSLLAVIALAWVFGSLAERVGYPAMMGEILAGIIFGPPLLGLVETNAVLDILAEFGVFLLMVYVGMEIDLHDLFELGPQSLMVAIGGFVFPFGLGYLAGTYLGMTVEASLFIGIALAATSLATKSEFSSISTSSTPGSPGCCWGEPSSRTSASWSCSQD